MAADPIDVATCRACDWHDAVQKWCLHHTLGGRDLYTSISSTSLFLGSPNGCRRISERIPAYYGYSCAQSLDRHGDFCRFLVCYVNHHLLSNPLPVLCANDAHTDRIDYHRPHDRVATLCLASRLSGCVLRRFAACFSQSRGGTGSTGPVSFGVA